MRLRPFGADHLTDLEFAQLAHQHGPNARLIASADNVAAAVRNVM